MTLRPIDAAQTLGEDRLRILNALNYLEQQQGIELRVAGVRQGYRMLNVPTDPEPVIQRMQEQFALRAAHIQRLRLCVTGQRAPSATNRHWCAISADPGGPLRPVRCARGKAAVASPSSQGTDLALIRAVRGETIRRWLHPGNWPVLCGISSPRASRATPGTRRLARRWTRRFSRCWPPERVPDVGSVGCGGRRFEASCGSRKACPVLRQDCTSQLAGPDKSHRKSE